MKQPVLFKQKKPALLVGFVFSSELGQFDKQVIYKSLMFAVQGCSFPSH